MPTPGIHPKKVLVAVWWSAAEAIHYLFSQRGETINAQNYCGQFDEKRKVDEENALPHISRTSTQTFNELQYESAPSDISLPNCHFFEHLDHLWVEKIQMR